ncbi:MAG: ACP S-malonyltransferase [Mariprofundaceae bacterium]|nr:ACP S-malonyltransferase [Mariprofundaceae bacterium]
MIKHTAFLFPGQGSQSQGMLLDMVAQEAVVRTCFEQASDVLGYGMLALIANNPDGRLNQTEYTQAVLLTASTALFRLWQQRKGITPYCVAGHSLGEYSALVAAGSLAFSDAVALVAYRGQVMNAALPVGMGKMVAVLNLTRDVVHGICKEASNDQHQVWLANDNCPGQLVIAGHVAAVDRAMLACKAAKARRVLPLSVSVPSHTPLMQPAADAMAIKLQETIMHRPKYPLWRNVDARPTCDVETIRNGLVNQLTSPVQWTDCIRKMLASGVTSAVEMGAGKVLTGLVRRIDKTIPVYPVHSPELLLQAIDATHLSHSYSSNPLEINDE